MISIVLNDTRLNVIRQENYSNHFEVPISIDFLKEKFQKKVNGKLTGLSQVFNQLLFRYNNKWSMTVSQQAIATQARLTRLHTGEMLRTLEDLGLIQIIRIKRHASTYVINPIFFTHEIRHALRKRLSELDDERVSKRKYYGDIICASKNAMNYASRSDISESYNNQKSITIYNDISYEENEPFVCDDGAIISSYTPYDFDSEPVQVLEKKDEKPENKQSISKKETLAMQDDLSSLIQANLYELVLVPVTSNLKSIRVTLYGQIRLCCYPEEAILYADQKLLAALQGGKKIEDPFKYFRGICEAWCKENEIKVDWPYMIEMGKQYKMPNDGPFYDSSFIPVKPVTSSSKRKKRTFNGNVEGGRQSVSLAEAIEHNRNLVKMYNPRLHAELEAKRTDEEAKHAAIVRQGETIMDEFAQARKKHDEEWEYTRINDPVKFARWDANAKAFRQMMGLNEDGTFQDGRSPHEAVDILLKSL